MAFERFGDGLVGAGGADGGDTCAVCVEPITQCGPDAMGLPCRHLFHRACLEPWLKKRDEAREPPDCPVCRHKLVSLMGESYAADYAADQMLQNRYAEWLILGRCECCQVGVTKLLIRVSILS